MENKQDLKQSTHWSGLIALFAGIFLIIFGATYGIINIQTNEYKNYLAEITKHENIKFPEYGYYLAARSALISGIDAYIEYISPSSLLNGKSIVDAYDEYGQNGISIKFILAQGQLESHFGTRGRGKTHNNPWNMGEYDNGKTHKNHIYKNPNDAVKPYVKFVVEKYLGNKQTIEDLLKNYKGLDGRIYATDKTYEIKLRNIYNKIDDLISITELCEEYEFRRLQYLKLKYYKLETDFRKYKIISEI